MKHLSQYLTESMNSEQSSNHSVINESLNEPNKWLKDHIEYEEQEIKLVKRIHSIAESAIKEINKEFPGKFTNFQIYDSELSSFWLLMNSVEFNGKPLWSNEIKSLVDLLNDDKNLKKYFDIVDTAWHDSMKSKSDFALRIKQ